MLKPSGGREMTNTNTNSIAIKNLNRQIAEIESHYLNAIIQGVDAKTLKLAAARARKRNGKAAAKEEKHFIELRPNFIFNVTTRIVQIKDEPKAFQKKQLFGKVTAQFEIYETLNQNITLNLVVPQRILNEWDALARLKGTNRRNYLNWIIFQKHGHPVQSQSNSYLNQINLIYSKDSDPQELAPYGGKEKFSTYKLVINRTVVYERLKKQVMSFFRNSQDIDLEKNLAKLITLYICFAIDSTYYQYCEYENEVHYMPEKEIL